MQSGRVIRRHNVILQSGSLGYADSRLYVEGEVEELCELDAWGDPGRVASRRWLWLRDARGQGVLPRQVLPLED